MDLRHLRYFIAVAEEGHFGRAAERLHIVQPALSMQIRALEEELGGALLVRTSRRVQLTAAGALLLTEARRTLAQAERAKDIVQRSLRGETGNVRVGFAGNAVLTGKLIGDLRAFREKYPAVHIELVEMAPHLQGESILAGELDVGYSPGLGLPSHSDLAAEAIGEWPFMLAMADDHPLAKKKRISLRMLAAEPLIHYATAEGDAGLPAMRERTGMALNLVRRESSTLSVLAFAATGAGIALVPESVENIAIPHLSYRPLAGRELTADLLLLSRVSETNGVVMAFLSVARVLKRKHANAPVKR
jgi:DNA-binding transcriptional LysR family regulator